MKIKKMDKEKKMKKKRTEQAESRKIKSEIVKNN